MNEDKKPPTTTFRVAMGTVVLIPIISIDLALAYRAVEWILSW